MDGRQEAAGWATWVLQGRRAAIDPPASLQRASVLYSRRAAFTSASEIR